jgi:hypothetical protein
MAPIRAVFILPNREESEGAKSGEKGGWGARTKPLRFMSPVVDRAVGGLGLLKCSTVFGSDLPKSTFGVSTQS